MRVNINRCLRAHNRRGEVGHVLNEYVAICSHLSISMNVERVKRTAARENISQNIKRTKSEKEREKGRSRVRMCKKEKEKKVNKEEKEVRERKETQRGV